MCIFVYDRGVQKTHFGQHPDCFGCKVQSVQLGGAPTEQSRRETWWEKDREAYRRFRDAGLQPKSVQHSYELETRATTDREIAMGRIISPTARKQVGHMLDDAEAVARTAQITPNSDDAKTFGESVRDRAKTA